MNKNSLKVRGLLREIIVYNPLYEEQNKLILYHWTETSSLQVEQTYIILVVDSLFS